MAENVVIGTRGSKLALWQASYIASLLKEKADVNSDIKTIKTKGDKILDVALAKIGDKGLFVKEIENELLVNNIDIAVHSMKDLPTDIPKGLKIVASPLREDYRDALISLKFASLADLPKGAIVGSSSLRRRAQILAQRPDLELRDIRGNVDTRLQKLKNGEFDAIIMSLAGLKRLKATQHIKQVFNKSEFLPAVGQGAIAVEARENDERVKAFLGKINDVNTFTEVKAERALMKELEGGCQVPIGAHATYSDGELSIEAIVSSLDGKTVVRGTFSGRAEEADKIGISLALNLKKQGAEEILDHIRKTSTSY